jgi:ATP-dependent Clp protease ATP-binding subunit ClpB
MVRIDMSEYMERHAVSRLVGAPPGYVGYDEGGQLTEAVRRRPYSVILFDEIEKAHQDVFNILLQVLDDGRLTDGQGRTVDFRNTVVIMTSNIGSHIIAEMAPAAPADEVERVRSRVLAELREHFRPEFLNRVDDIIVFSRLSREQLREIVGIQLRHLRERLAERKITLDIDDSALDVLAGEGYDPTYGARPLKRVIQRRLQDPLAMAILDGRLRDGETAVIRAPDGEILIETPQHSDAVPAGA